MSEAGRACARPLAVSCGSKICGSRKSRVKFTAALYSDSPCRTMYSVCAQRAFAALKTLQLLAKGC